MITVSDLRTVKHVADESEEDIAWLASVCEEVAWKAGTTPIRVGDPADSMLMVIDGSFQFFFVDRERRTLFKTQRAGDVTGLLPFSRMATYPGEGVVVEDGRVAVLHKRHFPELTRRMPNLVTHLVATMTDRVRDSTRSDELHERMFALGKWSAGLAHELNNPSAAIQRAVADLSDRIGALPVLVGRVVGLGITREQLEAARAELAECGPVTPGTMSPIDRGNLEREVGDWLEAHAVEEPYMVAEFLVEEGVTVDALDRLAELVPASALPDVVLWIERGLGAQRLLGEVSRSATRISDLVASVKRYTHMDRIDERLAVDAHEGLDSTLTMLGHAIRARAVHVERRYAPDLPKVFASPGALNQVWTNLLDNAIYAAGDGGRVEIETRRGGQMAYISITDNGPGIPDEIKERIFQPFFSTKPQGEGTGFGLEIARRLIDQHEGKISVESEPGRTTFEVCIPIAEHRMPRA